MIFVLGHVSEFVLFFLKQEYSYPVVVVQFEESSVENSTLS